MVAVNRLATDYLTNEITAAAGRVASVVDRETPLNPLPHGLVENLQVVDPRGKVVFSTPRLQGKPPIASFTPSNGRSTQTSVVCDRVFPRDQCQIVVAQRVYRSGEPWIVYSAAPVVPYLVHPRLALVLIGGAVFLTGAVTYVSYRVVRGSLMPVDAIRSELDEINATCLGRRVPVPSGKDEIHNLAESVNRTLDRLQSAMERQRQFASDAGHDLRSPITAMRAQVEDALMHPEDTDWVKTSESLVVSLDRLQAIVTDLLVIARLDSGEKVTRDYVNVAELVRTEVGRRFRGKRIALDLQHGVVVSGDRLQLVRLLTNLLDNAERHAMSTVTISVRRDVHHAVLEVVDDGEGIAPEQREIVFQRFTRLAAGREKDKQGTGLGLAIARDIAEQHGGSLTIEDSPKGTRFVLRAPLLAVRSPG